uniref:Xylanase inhibitor N-terminal domain-containing protein n=1 Tax=Chenopodium quinoa TaxID=63459 RepID=A0A803LIV7_CHEQI
MLASFAPYVILDTADDKIWVQTYGCDPCFEVKGGNTNVQLPVSFKLMSLDDPRCALPKFKYNGLCRYRSMYGSRSGPTTMGPMGTDTFLFIYSQTQKPTFFEDLAFGCGVENKNIMFRDNTGPEKHNFKEPNLGGSTMYFGDDARIVGPNVQQIAMNTKIKYHLYFTGFFIDSGAPSTFLAKATYQPLRLALVSYFAQYGWQPVKEQEYDLCYLSTPKEGQSYHPWFFIFRMENKEGRETPDPGPCIFGAYQMQTSESYMM